jgi:hypothetical protein
MAAMQALIAACTMAASMRRRARMHASATP